MTGAPKKPYRPRRRPRDRAIYASEVFIIESGSLADEANGMLEGEALATVLRMCGKHPLYYKLRTVTELAHAAKLFKQSKYRYLHVSTHGTSTEVCLTLERLSYAHFGEIFAKSLVLRRLFVSACEVGNKSFVQAVAANNKGMHSVLCPSDRIRFDKAIAFWAAFYVLAFDASDQGISHETLTSTVEKARCLLGLKFHAALYKPAPQERWEYVDLK